MKDKLLIIGAGGHGKVIADIALKMGEWKSVAFLDDDKSIKSSMGLEVIGRSEDASDYINDYNIFVGIGNNEIRENIQEILEEKGASIPVLIHPTAIIGENVKLGQGTVVMAGAVINCCTKIGKGNIINTSASLDHDNLTGDYVHISPGVNVAGAVTIGKRVWLGIGSAICNNISISKDCIIGAGSVVINDIKKTGTYIGVPARRLYELSDR